MSETIQSTPGGGVELEELSEPLEQSASDALCPGAVVATNDDASRRPLRVTALKSAKGTVNCYEATFEGDSRLVLLRETADKGVAEHWREEQVMLDEAACPMFPRVLSCFESNGKSYSVAESPRSSGTLSELLSAGLTIQQLLTILSQVAYALTKLHAAGWAHLGIRPLAIITGKPVSVTDFSYATRIGERPSQSFYHAGYSAPELLLGEPIDPRADIYSVGALLFHAIAGKPIAETGPELTAWSPAKPAAGVPQILHKCLGSPDSRYATMGELHQALVRLARRYAPSADYEFAATTSIGLDPSRSTNQDAYGHLSGKAETDGRTVSWAVATVADGMGGMDAGELASESAVKALLAASQKTFTAAEASFEADDHERLVVEWVRQANTDVCQSMEQRGAKGGSTLVCASIVDKQLAIGHVGDCRIYLFREGKLSLLTRDHSLVMGLVMQGEITIDQLRGHADRSSVTRSLGERKHLQDYFVDTLRQTSGSATLGMAGGDVLMLCSDGLWEPVLEEDIVNILSGKPQDISAAAKDLVRLALDRGGPDNTTILLIRIRETNLYD